MANSTHCLFIGVGPKAQIQAFQDAVLDAPAADFRLFEHPTTASGNPFFHRVYHCAVLGCWEQQIGDACYGESFDEDWENLDLWQHFPRFGFHGAPDVLSGAANVSPGSAAVELEVEFRLVPPPGILHLARMFPGCSWRLQFGFEGVASDWSIDPHLIAEVQEARIDWKVPEGASIDARVAFDAHRLREELRIGTRLTSGGVCNGIRIWRDVPTELCQRVVVPDLSGEVHLPDGSRGHWAAPSALGQSPARALLFDWTAAANLSPGVLKTDAHLGSVELDFQDEGFNLHSEGWSDLDTFCTRNLGDRIPFRIHNSTHCLVSDDFIASCDDFESEAYRLLQSCYGDMATFESNARQLSSLVTSGVCRLFAMVCEAEDETVDLEFQPDSVRVR